MGALDLIALMGAVLAVWLRAICSGAETALASVGRRQAEAMVAEKLRGAKSVLALKARADRTSTTLRAAQAAALALAGALAALLGVHRLGPQLSRFLGTPGGALAGAVVAGLLAAGGVFLLGDLLPRAYATHAAPKVARRLAVPARITVFFGGPFVSLARWIADRLLAPFGLDTARLRAVPPLDELERHLATHAARGGLAVPTPELIHQIFEFGETTAKEVMVPRTQVVALEIGATSGDILELLAGKGHTRVPVYREEIDNIVGLINAKDIIPLVERGEPIELLKVLRPAPFVPWSKPIGELMREMQQNHVHLAAVVDEFGGFMGIITLEDILEEIVGEIEDEFDRPEAEDVEALADGSFLVRGSMDVEDFNRAFTAQLPEDEDFETVAGFLNLLAGAIPATGDTFFHDGLQLTVVKRNDRRVRQVRVRRVRPLPAEPRA